MPFKKNPFHKINRPSRARRYRAARTSIAKMELLTAGEIVLFEDLLFEKKIRCLHLPRRPKFVHLIFSLLAYYLNIMFVNNLTTYQ